MPRMVKTGLLVALLAVFALGGVSAIGAGRFGVPTAHAASTCHARAIGYIGETFSGDMVGDGDVVLSAYYDDSTHQYCGYMTVQAEAYIYPGSHGGYLWGGLYDCSGNLYTGTNVKLMSGNGTPPGNPPYYNQTIVSSQVYGLPCAYAVLEVWYYPKANDQYMMSAVTPHETPPWIVG
jgi:hypothetical protein